MTVPVSTINMVPIEAARSAAGMVSREWGEYGYRIGGAIGRSMLGYHFPVLCSDGSYFEVASDAYGNTAAVAESDNLGRY